MMKSLCTCLILFSIVLTGVVSQEPIKKDDEPPKKKNDPPKNGSNGAFGFFTRLDANRDGKLSEKEIGDTGPVIIRAYDRDGDNLLAKWEFFRFHLEGSILDPMDEEIEEVTASNMVGITIRAATVPMGYTLVELKYWVKTYSSPQEPEDDEPEGTPYTPGAGAKFTAYVAAETYDNSDPLPPMYLVVWEKRVLRRNSDSVVLEPEWSADEVTFYGHKADIP
jgi:hypothetical protein